MAMGLGGLLFGGIFFMLFIGILSILAFVFWIIMLVDAIKRNYKKSDEKIIWVLVIILTGIIGALIYYFVVKRENKK
ncbi:MAG TPA: PLDc N-terminal domain-containing protein [Candidatus Omnitrophota bacterium]|nr:PLDc N-terminal domain-containing protein [Candidatus Omnitrophota bacterium]